MANELIEASLRNDWHFPFRLHNCFIDLSLLKICRWQISSRSCHLQGQVDSTLAGTFYSDVCLGQPRDHPLFRIFAL